MHRGFTLIEIIAVLAILAILAALGVTGMNGFIRHAKQTARDSVAKTLFMAAQTALTHAYNQNPDFYLENRSPEIPGPDYSFLPAGEAEKMDHTPLSALVYLKLDKGADNSGLPLYRMLSPYINDKSVLSDSILIEYNRETGKVLSTFYSEVEGVTFGYGPGGTYDVRGRDETAAREAAFVGFYGVNSTGEVVRPNPIDPGDYRVLLVDYVNAQAENYGLLTAEVEIKREEAEDPTNTYSLTLISMAGMDETLTFSLNGADSDFRLDDLTGANPRIDSVERALENPLEIGGRRIPIYCEQGAAKWRVVIVLDGVRAFGDTVTPDIGIHTTFPGIAGGFLTAELAVNNDPDVIYYSDERGDERVHSLYGYDSSADTSRLTVMSVRHLNNIRFCRDNSRFVQTQNVYMWDYKGEKINFTPLCNRFDAPQNDPDNYGFRGTYASHESYAIFDFNVDLTQQDGLPDSISGRLTDDESLYNAGLFDTIRSGAKVENVRFAASEPVVGETPRRLRVVLYNDDNAQDLAEAVATVKGVQYAGGIAAVNDGTIENCTMLGYVSANMTQGCADDGTAGGIAGKNDGKITKCATMCAVTGNLLAGGIAGQTTDTISLCEAGTASWRLAEDPTQLYRSGTPQFGAADERNGVYADGTHTTNNTYRVMVKKSGGMAGGIVGSANAGAQVRGCVNACKVEAGNLPDGAGAHDDGMAGGIAGELNDTGSGVAIDCCYNAGAVYATGSAGGSAGGIVGHVERGGVAYCYNTGRVNWEWRADALPEYKNDITYYFPGISRNLDLSHPPNRAGGLLGSGTEYTRISDCYSMQYTGDAYGGAFGILHKEATVSNCIFLKNIHNTTKEYYVTDSKTTGRADTIVSPLRMYTVDSLIIAPSEGDLGNFYFENGALLNPVGPFKFKFPRLVASPDGALPVHRTPWRPTIERYGKIDLSGPMRENTEIICKFYLAPPEGYIYVRNGNYGQNARDIICCIPLYNARGFNSLTDARFEAASDRWLDIYGFECTYDQLANYINSSTYKPYTFKFRARKLSEADWDDAVKIAAGFTYEYEIRMTYGTASRYDVYYSHISSQDYTCIEAELYNTQKPGTTQQVDADRIGNAEITIFNPTNPATGRDIFSRVLRISGVAIENGRWLFMEFPGHTTGTRIMEMDANTIANAPHEYDRALESNKRVSFVGGGPGAGFPYYVETNPDGSMAINLVLFAEGSDVPTSPTAPPPPTLAQLNAAVDIPAGENEYITLTASRVEAITPQTQKSIEIGEKRVYSWDQLV